MLHGHLGSFFIKCKAMRLRSVGRELIACLSVRIGVSARFVTGGKLSRFDQPSGFGV